MITLQFPTGLVSFTDSGGTRVAPDGSGQCSIDIDKYGEYLAAGFMPAALIGAEIEQEADVVALKAAVSAAQSAIGTLQTNAGLDETAISGAQGNITALQNDATLRAKALSGHLLFVASPATVGRAATGAAWQRTVTITLKTAAGDVHTWFNKAITAGVSIADTSDAGTASITGTTLTFVNGVATVVVSGDAQAWLAAETDTLTIAAAVILGVTVASKTSVQTFTA